MPWQTDGEGRAANVCRVDVDPAAVPLHDVVRELEADAHAPGVVGLRGTPPDANERAEDLVHVDGEDGGPPGVPAQGDLSLRRWRLRSFPGFSSW
jgi:hypothetical protein